MLTRQAVAMLPAARAACAQCSSQPAGAHAACRGRHAPSNPRWLVLLHVCEASKGQQVLALLRGSAQQVLTLLGVVFTSCCSWQQVVQCLFSV